MTKGEEVPFGKQFREKYFNFIEPGVVCVNHGSYGLSPEPILDQYCKEVRRENTFPDLYIRKEVKNYYRAAVKELGVFLNCNYQNLAIVANATTAVNTILRSYPFQKGDKIVIASTIYGSCNNTVKFLEKRIGIEPIVVTLNYPLEDDEVVSIFRDIFEKESPKLCLFDAITSMPGVRTPYEEITKLCKEYNVLSLLDGAHSAGLLPINLDFQPDFYLSCLHKWMYVPRGCAVMYVDKKHFRHIQTLSISHSYVDDDATLDEDTFDELLISKFSFIGTGTIANLKIIKQAIDFRKDVCGGEENIRNFCYDLALKVGKSISEKWETSVLENKAKTLTTTLVNVEVPLGKLILQNDVNYDIGLDKTDIFKDFMDILMDKMMERKTFVPLIFHNGKLYARFSCQIYNELEDYEFASDVLIECLNEYLQSRLLNYR